LLYGERPRAQKLAAMAVGLCGLLLLTYPRGGGDWNRGDLITALCAAVYGVTIVETAHRARRHDAVRLGALQIAACAVFFWAALGLVHALPAGALGELSRQEARPLVPSVTLALQIIYMGLGCTALTYTVQTWAMARMSATDAALIFALEPVIASALGLLVFGWSEWPGVAGALGGGLVIVAVIAAELRPG
jgi:drug/metabolite transporter (DMT)-like permease